MQLFITIKSKLKIRIFTKYKHFSGSTHSLSQPTIVLVTCLLSVTKST